MAQKIHYEATIRVTFVPSWEIGGDDEMWDAAGGMTISIEQLVMSNDPTVKVIEIVDYAECFMEDPATICYEAVLKVDFVPSWGIANDDDMYAAADVMSGSIKQLVEVNDSSVKAISISGFDECYMQNA